MNARLSKAIALATCCDAEDDRTLSFEWFQAIGAEMREIVSSMRPCFVVAYPDADADGYAGSEVRFLLVTENENGELVFAAEIHTQGEDPNLGHCLNADLTTRGEVIVLLALLDVEGHVAIPSRSGLVVL